MTVRAAPYWIEYQDRSGPQVNIFFKMSHLASRNVINQPVLEKDLPAWHICIKEMLPKIMKFHDIYNIDNY
jgi:hypothetical protein